MLEDRKNKTNLKAIIIRLQPSCVLVWRIYNFWRSVLDQHFACRQAGSKCSYYLTNLQTALVKVSLVRFI